MELIISLLSGAVGGNIAGALMKDLSLGGLGNSIAGIIGGGLGGTLLGMLGLVGGGGELGAILASVASGGVGGGLLLAIIGLIKKAIG